MTNPYEQLPPTAFWRLAIGNRDPLQVEQLWTPKFGLSREHKVVTAGSCFAQHIGRALAVAGYSWYDAEPAPEILPEVVKGRFNYGIFSFRTSNIYTVALLRQWLSWSFGSTPESDETWTTDGRFHDPFRPAIEPGGFRSEAELFASRASTLQAIRRAVSEADIFVFTLGLTETWIDRASGHVYPICPGTIAGEFDPERHVFQNFRYEEIRRDLISALDMMRSLNPRLRFLLTVSPVPLTATASGDHVLVATIRSKSALRAVAGDVAEDRADTDYFPSYEIVSGFPFKGMFYDDNMRTVSRRGVDFVMQSFFAGMRTGQQPVPGETSQPETATAADEAGASPEDVVCEEILLEAFAKDRR